jgi:hypothetical protein
VDGYTSPHAHGAIAVVGGDEDIKSGLVSLVFLRADGCGWWMCMSRQ